MMLNSYDDWSPLREIVVGSAAAYAGDEIIEIPPMLRARYFETQFLKPFFMEYFGHGARWTIMPRPLMTDGSFDFSHALGEIPKRSLRPAHRRTTWASR